MFTNYSALLQMKEWLERLPGEKERSEIQPARSLGDGASLPQPMVPLETRSLCQLWACHDQALIDTSWFHAQTGVWHRGVTVWPPLASGQPGLTCQAPGKAGRELL